GIGGEIPLGEQRGKKAVARAMTHMQRLGHGGEGRLDAAGERGGGGGRGRRGPGVGAEGVTTRRRPAPGAQGRRAGPAPRGVGGGGGNRPNPRWSSTGRRSKGRRRRPNRESRSDGMFGPYAMKPPAAACSPSR